MNKYIYFISDNQDSDFFTTSFEIFSDKICVYNWEESNFNISDLKYIAIDHTKSTSNMKYVNDNMRFYLVEFLEMDLDRFTLTLLLKSSIIKYT